MGKLERERWLYELEKASIRPVRPSELVGFTTSVRPRGARSFLGFAWFGYLYNTSQFHFSLG